MNIPIRTKCQSLESAKQNIKSVNCWWQHCHSWHYVSIRDSPFFIVRWVRTVHAKGESQMQSNSESERKCNVKYCNTYKAIVWDFVSRSQSAVTCEVLKFPISLTKFIPLATEEEWELVEGSLERATPTQQLQVPTASPRSHPARLETYKVRAAFSQKENWLWQFPCALKPGDSTFLGCVIGILPQ